MEVTIPSLLPRSQRQVNQVAEERGLGKLSLRGEESPPTPVKKSPVKDSDRPLSEGDAGRRSKRAVKSVLTNGYDEEDTNLREKIGNDARISKEKENIDPDENANEDGAGKKDVKTKRKKLKETTDQVEAAVENEEEDGDDSNEELVKDEIKYIEDVRSFLAVTDLGLVPDPPTKGDGNCWYRAAADQVTNLILQGVH